MSKADEMFKKLGYIKRNNLDESYIEFVRYEAKECYSISFCKGKVMCALYVNGILFSRGLAIDMQELQAINEKCKELGWLDE